MILITGASGTIGGHVLRLLAEAGRPVRAMTREPARLAAPAGVEVVAGDFTDETSLTTAFTGVTSAFLLSAPGPGVAGHDLAAVAAARATGVSRLVKLSAIGTGEDSALRTAGWHLPGERALRDSGLAWTVLRPSTFASNTLSWADAVRAGQPVPNPSGDGEQGVVDPRDVAAVAAAVLTADVNSGGHDGRTYTLTGPELISVPGQVAVLAELLGRPVPVANLTDAEYRELLTGYGLPEEFVSGALTGTAFVRAGGNAVVTGDVPAVLGRPAASYATWAADHLAAFR